MQRLTSPRGRRSAWQQPDRTRVSGHISSCCTTPILFSSRRVLYPGDRHRHRGQSGTCALDICVFARMKSLFAQLLFSSWNWQMLDTSFYWSLSCTDSKCAQSPQFGRETLIGPTNSALLDIFFSFLCAQIQSTNSIRFFCSFQEIYSVSGLYFYKLIMLRNDGNQEEELTRLCVPENMEMFFENM